ncbi:unnamed protein product [Kuraishia capsulata CBS 1993]|uniref:Copper transport protein n=1 Tax=Kuraishia capsulata CBS 1993 TaxID=1382522 RepID=W6MJ19_9ASCO|nr:uncharacterized protein KUCA_T00001919001 [Kuraishia capsulata CBS 1993]CDK25948.1 unnamed protein product [Kuraishia capsulata CBS 1993]
MDMSGMDMGTSSSSSMSMVMTSAKSSVKSMATAMASSSTMDMSSTATSSMDMSSSTGTSSSMDMSSSMNMYFSSTYKGTPVLFKTLHAATGGSAFGIFVFLFFSAFLLRGLFFLSAYIEQKVFHNLNNSVVITKIDECACDPGDEEKGSSSASSGKPKTFLQQLLFPGMAEAGKDLVRLLLAFLISMVGYAVMLAAMSYVVLYFFAICLGFAFGDVFFNRISIILDVNKNSALCGAFH